MYWVLDDTWDKPGSLFSLWSILLYFPGVSVSVSPGCCLGNCGSLHRKRLNDNWLASLTVVTGTGQTVLLCEETGSETRLHCLSKSFSGVDFKVGIKTSAFLTWEQVCRWDRLLHRSGRPGRFSQVYPKMFLLLFCFSRQDISV